MTQTIDVLLATFNGARFLPEQLASIAAQIHRDWRLIVRDDGSDDASPEIIEAFADRHGERVRVLRDGRGRLGVRDNFAALLAASDAPYFMFCDQDDIWLPDKMLALLRRMQEVEKRREDETPILVHSDLIVVDDEGHERHASYWRSTRLFDPAARHHPLQIIVRNYVTGCAAIGNAALRRAALPIPAEAFMHDWWVGLVAAVLGEIAEDKTPTVLYRQHTGNELGAQPRSLFGVLSQFFRAPQIELDRVRFYIKKSRQQVAAFLGAHPAVPNAEVRCILCEYAGMSETSIWQRKYFLSRHGLWPDYWLPSIVCWWFL